MASYRSRDAARLNVSRVDPDPILREVLAKLREVHLVDGAIPPAAASLERVLGTVTAGLAPGLRARPPGTRSLDLIAHARGGVLRLGRWSPGAATDDEALRSRCEDPLSRLALDEIRLLGCNTAVGDAARRAMSALHRTFGVPVWGTLAPITADDFGASGFSSDGLLVGHADMGGAVGMSADLWFARLASVPGVAADLIQALRRERLLDIFAEQRGLPRAWRWPVRELDRRPFEQILASASLPLARAPGLLALPDLDLIFRVGRGRALRITVLLDHQIARIHLDGPPHTAVFRIRRGRAWDAIVKSSRAVTRR